MTVDAGIRRGFDMHAYRNTGTYGTPVWSEMTNMRDLELGLKRTRIDSSIRGFGGVKSEVPGLMEIAPKWDAVYDQSDANLAAIQTAFNATTVGGAPVEFAFCDGLIGGSGIRYLRAVCGIFGCDEKQDLDGIDIVSIEVGPTYNANQPSINTA